jgi:hypothetical protein
MNDNEGAFGTNKTAAVLNPLDRRRNHPTGNWHNLQGSIGLYEKDAEVVNGILHPLPWSDPL